MEHPRTLRITHIHVASNFFYRQGGMHMVFSGRHKKLNMKELIIGCPVFFLELTWAQWAQN